jgi:hypothetical protein
MSSVTSSPAACRKYLVSPTIIKASPRKKEEIWTHIIGNNSFYLNLSLFLPFNFNGFDHLRSSYNLFEFFDGWYFLYNFFDEFGRG